MFDKLSDKNKKKLAELSRRARNQSIQLQLFRKMLADGNFDEEVLKESQKN